MRDDKAPERKLTRNAIRCNHCGTVAESTHRHHYQPCECGAVAADGGLAYLRRAFKTNYKTDYTELSTYDDGDTAADETDV